MTAFRNRLLGLTAGTLVLSCFSSMAYAQTTKEVLNFTGSTVQATGNPNVMYSIFTFTQSLILNSIGFVYEPNMDPYIRDYSFGYSIVLPGESLSGMQNVMPSVLGNGVVYFHIPSPTTYASGTQVYVITQGVGGLTFARSGFDDYLVGVTHTNIAGSTFASGNLRVTALGGSVAPEPGSFALALTGGAALIGICMRRRRNAA